MKNKFLSILLAGILGLVAFPAFAADKLKIGKSKYKAVTAIPSNVVGDSVTVSFAGRKGRKVGTANFIFQKLTDQIVEGAEFEVISGAGGQDGKVFIMFTDQSTNRKGKTKLLASDDQSVGSGRVKILSVNSNGGFTFSVNAEISNNLQRVSNPLKGDIQGTDSRSNKSARISGKITAN